MNLTRNPEPKEHEMIEENQQPTEEEIRQAYLRGHELYRQQTGKIGALPAWFKPHDETFANEHQGMVLGISPVFPFKSLSK